MPATPTVKILKALKRNLRAVDWTAAGFPELLVRHQRRRYPTEEELPCISIRWVSEEPKESDQESGFYTADEMLVDMLVELAVDAVIPPEPDDEDLDDDDVLDPTGLGAPSEIAAIACRALRDPEAPLSLIAEVFDRGRSDDDDGTADKARFVQVIIVRYRVLVSDPSILLGQGEQA